MLANFCMKSICFMANFAPWRIVLTFGSIHVISVETFACWLSLVCNPVYVCRFFFLLTTMAKIEIIYPKNMGAKVAMNFT